MRVDLEEGEVVISFEGRDVTYDVAELDEVAPPMRPPCIRARAQSIPAVGDPRGDAGHYPMLARNLLYTGRDAG